RYNRRDTSHHSISLLSSYIKCFDLILGDYNTLSWEPGNPDNMESKKQSPSLPNSWKLGQFQVPLSYLDEGPASISSSALWMACSMLSRILCFPSWLYRSDLKSSSRT